MNAFTSVADLLADNPLVLLSILLAVGSMIGAITVGRFSLGPAAVLFLALALSAYDERLKIPVVVGQLGLALFAYCIGVSAGPSFFSALRTGGRMLTTVVTLLVVAAGVTLVMGKILGLTGPVLSGVYAGSLTNTPALAASASLWKSQQPVVGYSVTYLGGVLGMLLAAGIAVRMRRPDDARQEPTKAPSELARATVRVDADDLPDLQALASRYDDRVVFSRLMVGDEPGHPGTIDLPSAATEPQPGDILTVVGDKETVARVVSDLGHASSVALVLDRSHLDFRRMAVSSHEVAGHTLGDLDLPGRFTATATRVRRGDVDLLATDDLVLALGDRVRIVAPREQLPEVATYLGDSERGASDINPIGLFLGLGLGLLLGLVVVPLPGGQTLALGVAGGPLLVGLVLGRLQRSGPVLWSLPHSVSSTLSQFGMLAFLAYAGSTSGAALAKALASDIGPRLLIAGAVVTAVTAVGLLLSRHLTGAYGAALAGVVAGTQTQPAVLAYSNDITKADPRVNLGYALVYPVAMIVKVVLAPILGGVL
jgi:putative transport protein